MCSPWSSVEKLHQSLLNPLHSVTAGSQCNTGVYMEVSLLCSMVSRCVAAAGSGCWVTSHDALSVSVRVCRIKQMRRNVTFTLKFLLVTLFCSLKFTVTETHRSAHLWILFS